MTIFAVIAAEQDVPALENEIRGTFAEGSYYKIAPGQYLVDAPAFTSQALSDTLKLPKLGQRVLVMPVYGYAGWHSREMWEWLTTHLSSSRPAA